MHLFAVEPSPASVQSSVPFCARPTLRHGTLHLRQEQAAATPGAAELGLRRDLSRRPLARSPSAAVQQPALSPEPRPKKREAKDGEDGRGESAPQPTRPSMPGASWPRRPRPGSLDPAHSVRAERAQRTEPPAQLCCGQAEEEEPSEETEGAAGESRVRPEDCGVPEEGRPVLCFQENT